VHLQRPALARDVPRHGAEGRGNGRAGYNTPSDNVYAPHEPPYLRVFHHNLSLQAAAYQNGIWVVATAKAGKEDGFWLHGGSVIVAPTGEIVAKERPRRTR